ncbi:MAG: Fe-S cluster assembly protein SufD [Bacteroidales bacterium]|nr:Fe-S cluster assembly protein SufD [Bacteroidales bacterium]
MENQEKMTAQEKFIDYAKKSIETISSCDSPRIKKLRQEALNRFIDRGFPTNKMEKWRNSKLLECLNQDFNIESIENKKHDFCCVIQNLDAEVVTITNGFYSDENLKTLSSGIIIGSTHKAMQEYPELFEKYFGTCNINDDNGFYDINTALWKDGFFIYAPKNIVAEKPIQIIKITDEDNSPFIQTRNLIIAEANSQLQIIDCDDSIKEQSSFVNSYTEIIIGENAQLENYKLQNLNDNSSLLNTNTIKQLANSRLQTHTVSFNGGKIRNNIFVDIDGEGAECNLYGLYLVDKTQHVDNQIKVNHNVANCNSTEKFKGILDNEATAVFNGHVYVAPNAQKTNAYQNNSNIILTDKAKISTMPFLEIYADDVKCSHGSSIGQLDQEAMFYMQQRGISRENARMLLMYAFAAEISNNIGIEALRERIDDMIKRRLKGELSCCENCVFQCNTPKEYDFKIDLSKI